MEYNIQSLVRSKLNFFSRSLPVVAWGFFFATSEGSQPWKPPLRHLLTDVITSYITSQKDGSPIEFARPLCYTTTESRPSTNQSLHFMPQTAPFFQSLKNVFIHYKLFLRRMHISDHCLVFIHVSFPFTYICIITCKNIHVVQNSIYLLSFTPL